MNITDVEILERGRLLKEAITIINKLAENDLADIDGDITIDDFDWIALQTLVIKARELKGDRWWK